jgi:hypothetical protein
LRILNTLGEEYHVKFDDALLSMNAGAPVCQGKIDGLRHFRGLGYHIVAVIDNDRENLEAIAASGLQGARRLLPAEVIRKSWQAQGRALPYRKVF